MTREYKRIQGNTGKYKNTRKYRKILENIYKRIQKNTLEYEEYEEIQRNALGLQVNTEK